MSTLHLQPLARTKGLGGQPRKIEYTAKQVFYDRLQGGGGRIKPTKRKKVLESKESGVDAGKNVILGDPTGC